MIMYSLKYKYNFLHIIYFLMISLFINCENYYIDPGYPTINISKTNDVTTPYEIKPGYTYQISIPNSHIIYYKSKAFNNDGFTVTVNKFINGLNHIIFSYYNNDKAYTDWHGGRRLGYLVTFYNTFNHRCIFIVAILKNSTTITIL